MFQKLKDYLYSTETQEQPKFEFALNKDQKIQLKSSEEKPTVVALYDKSGGTTFCDLTVDYFKSKGIEVTPVSPSEGLNHPVFKGKVHGIYLPGGPNVPVQDSSDPRKKFEGELTHLAKESDIPLLGICRGLQTIGHHQGYDVCDIPEDHEQRQPHYDKFDSVYQETEDPTYNNKVVVKRGSLLHTALQYKLKNKDDNDIEYNVTCLHHQHMQLDEVNRNLWVSGYSKHDGLVESVEKRTGRYWSAGLQHHPEAVISSCEDARKEKLQELEDQLEKSRSTSNYLDPDFSIHAEISYASQMRRVRNTRTRDEKAARAELGFFTKQVKHNYLAQAPKKVVKETSYEDYLFSC